MFSGCPGTTHERGDPLASQSVKTQLLHTSRGLSDDGWTMVSVSHDASVEAAKASWPSAPQDKAEGRHRGTNNGGSLKLSLLFFH